MSKYYLAYGSNLNVRQMRFRCPTAIVVGKGTIKGYRLLFKGSKTGSYLTIEKAKGYEVPVAVWKVDEPCEKALDRYEGYPNFYYKKEIEIDYISIKKKEPRRCKAFAYIMHEERELGIPSRGYVEVCLEGYKTFGFNPILIEEAIIKSMEEK
jgi:gamma-glutamylcyclotransferase (GGCT)/AIG2-like uncharacterized protein YtfP